MNDPSLVPWAPRPTANISPNADAMQVVQHAVALRPNDAQKAIRLVNAGELDVAAELVWHRGISKLRSTLASLGMRFVGEMLGRADIDESSTPERVLTEYDTIRLAEQLGLVDPTGILRLLQSSETLAHFEGEKAMDVISDAEAMTMLRTAAQYLLKEPQIGYALDFANLRTRLFSETLTEGDSQFGSLVDSPPFFLGTTTRVLLAGIKNEKGARLEHALRNLSIILPRTWLRLPEQERWNLGFSYAEVSVAGNAPAVIGLRHVLHLVSGFDYVPESLRSNSYRKAAQAVIDAHYGTDNFHRETLPTQQLANMGTSIPRPASGECIQAFLCVYIGNFYGYSWEAAPIAIDQLKKLTPDLLQYYLERVLPTDGVILGELQSTKPAQRFSSLVIEMGLSALVNQQASTYNLVIWASQNRADVVVSQARSLWNSYKVKI